MQTLSQQQNQILHNLIESGYSITPAFITTNEVQTMRREVDYLWEEGEFKAATIGRGDQQQRQPEIRGDLIRWLNETDLTPIQAIYWQQINQLRQLLNRELFLNLQEFEAHLAVYPAGSFYKRHLDQHRHTQRRQIACILYLNIDWQPTDEGQLRIYPQANDWDRYIDVKPQGGTFVCFRCDTIFHEVRPSRCERASLTGWLCRHV